MPLFPGLSRVPELTGTGRVEPGGGTRAVIAAVARVDPWLWACLLIFVALVAPHLGAVPIWDSRVYYDWCLLPGISGAFHPLNFNCFGHPSMLYMLLFAPLQWISGGSALLLNLTNVALGCVAIAAFWILTGELWPGDSSRGDRFLGTAILAAWPAAVANSLSMNPDYGVFVFFLLYLAALIKERIPTAALAGMFLVLSKEAGVVLYGLTTLLYVLLFARRNPASGESTWSWICRHVLLLLPAIAYLANIGLTLTRDQPVIWGGAAATLPRVLKRFFFFNPGEILAGRYGPLIWILSMSWILTACLLAALLKTAFRWRVRGSFRGEGRQRRALVFVLLLFPVAVYGLTRYETFSHARYLLALAPLFILAFVESLHILLARPLPRRALLAATLLLLLASNFRTVDPVSRRLWGTFPFGRHQLLELTSWTNECCGRSMDQLVYNLEYLKFDEILSAIFTDLRPTYRKTFVGSEHAELTRVGAVTAEGRRTLRHDSLRIRCLMIDDVDRRRVPPESVYFVAFPNLDNGPDFQRLRRMYSVESVKTYERSGYAIPVYTMRRKAQRADGLAMTSDQAGP